MSKDTYSKRLKNAIEAWVDAHDDPNNPIVEVKLTWTRDKGVNISWEDKSIKEHK